MGGNGQLTCPRRNRILRARLESPTQQKTIFSNDDDESPTTQLLTAPKNDGRLVDHTSLPGGEVVKETYDLEPFSSSSTDPDISIYAISFVPTKRTGGGGGRKEAVIYNSLLLSHHRAP